MASSDPRNPHPLAGRCTSSGNAAALSSSLQQQPPPLAPRTPAPSSPSRRAPGISGLPLSSSPLSSGSSAPRRRRQSSFSSSVSNTTDATSYEESGDDCTSQDGAEKERGAGGSAYGSSSSSFGTLAGAAGGAGAAAPPSRRFSVTPPPSVHDHLPPSGSSGALSPPHAVSIPPSSSLPISIATSIPPSSVRLSTTPLFPSPLAQASGPEEHDEPSRGEEGDSEGEDDDGSAWPDRARASSPLTREVSVPFGDLELSPPTGTIALPEPSSPVLEPSVTPRPPARSRHRQSPSEARDSSPEQDLSRTAKASRVRSLGRSSGLAAALNAAGEETVQAKRRSREFSALTGLGVETKGASTSAALTSPPTRSGALHTSFSTMAASPPSPSSSLSASPSSVSRRASLNLVSPPRSFQPSSPTSARTTRGSISGSHTTGVPIPLPFPAAPPPSDAIKLQKVPESVRSALEFRQPSALSSAYLGEALSAPVSHGFNPSTSPKDVRLPRTPTATRAPSPTSSPSARSSITSPSASRGPSERPSRQPSQEKLTALTEAAPSNPGASSAFAPLFPFPHNAPAVPAPTRTRDRARSVQYPSGQPLTAQSFQDPGDVTGPVPHTQTLCPAPVFNLSPFGDASSGGRAPSDSSQRAQHKASASISSIDPPPASSRLAVHRTSVAPAGVRSDAGNGQSTDEYAQIILSTRNAKVRKWKSPGASTLTSTLEPGTAGTGKTFTGLGATDEEPAEADVTAGDAAEFGLQSETKEIEWVDWLDEYRKMKEAKLRADEQNDDEEERRTEGEGEEQQVEERRAARQPSPPSARREDFAEPALTALQKGKAKATTTDFNPFEATSAPHRSTVTTGSFLTPGVPLHHDYFPLSPHGMMTSTTGVFQPTTTATPMSVGDPFDFAPLQSTVSNAGTASTGVGSPGVKHKKRNFAKLGHKIDTWWSAVRSSFTLTDEDKFRHRRTSTDQPLPHSAMPAIEPILSRTSSQFARPTSPGTPALRNVASAHDLRPSPSPIPPNPFHDVVPTGALAPAARVDSSMRLKPPPDRERSLSSSGEDSGSAAPSSKTWRNPHLSLNLAPNFNTLPAKRSTRDSPSPRSGPPSIAKAGTPPPPPPSSRPDAATAPVPVPVPAPAPSTSYSPSTTSAYSPMWDRTPGLVPSSSHFPVRERERRASNTSRPKAVTSKGSSSFSVQTVRQQIRQRLASAKENCDKELRRIVADITAYVETELHKDIRSPLPSGALEGGRFGALVADEAAPGYASNVEYEDSGSEAVADVDAEGYEEAGYGYTDSDGGSTSKPPSRLKSPHLAATPGVRRRSGEPARARSTSPRRASLTGAARQRRLTSAPRSDRPRSVGGSNASSRSNSQSRSRSPLPPGLGRSSHGSRSPGQASPAAFGNSNTELAQSAFIVLLQEITTVASEILDTPISKLSSKPGSCGAYIARVQQIGEAWNDNPELPCRGWYVQLLLAVAGLSRVLEWWEAEKGFWTFDDGSDGDSDPILFVAKPSADESPEVRARGESISSVPSMAALQPTAPKWSPLGIDLGVQSEAPPKAEEDGRRRESSTQVSETEIKQRADDLRQAVESIRAQTLLVELSLDGQLLQYISSAWQEVVGLDPEECLDAPISDFLYSDDAAVFAEATRQLEADDSHTVEVSFRLRVSSSSQTSQDDEPPEDLYEAMEGKGMLMLDGLTGAASHTMWVVRPAPYSEAAEQASQSLGRYGFDALHWRSTSDPAVTLHPSRLNLEPILCRICERPTPAWFFEKHNETCNEVHRLEGDISECNDRLKELLRTVDELAEHLDEANPDEDVEYRGIPLTHSPAATPPTYLEGLRGPLASKPSPTSHQVRRSQQRVFDHVQEIVQIALSISTPTVTDETGEIPIQEQRLLSPNSENSLAAVMRWQRPLADEPAMVRLVSDCEEQTRFKLNSVNRLRNTILYAEKVRQEWEQKASEILALVHEEARTTQPSPLPFDSPQLQPLPSDESPRHIDALDLPPARPNQQLRRQVSQPLGLLSPMLSPEDASPLSTSPSAQLLLSPRIPAAVPSSRTKASSIKDFKILKPISKGAFGSVYLAKKNTTGDYYAIKVLKKSDMVAKNQVTNVKAERMILMTQTDSEFVVKLYYTFQSKDYLYLVMEYLNGGDCAALVKNLGGLPEDWARRYIAEVVVGLDHLHTSGIIHRDLKPDNLLIDSKGHLKLTDFGLSRIGLLGRQTQLPSMRDGRRPSAALGRTGSGGPDFSTGSSPIATPALTAVNQSQASYFGNVPITDSFSLESPADSSGSSVAPSSHAGPRPSPLSPNQAVPVRGPPGAATETSKAHFVGTPDYLAPESILGVGMDACVDWWALGVICYEFLYGFPPFHDETPEKVFENILSRRFEWHEDEIDISPEAHDFMDKLLCSDSSRRLGSKGAAEVKAHPFLADVDWDNLLTQPVDFVPKVADPESTDYFDPRGATAQEFKDGETSDDAAVAEDPAVSSDPAVRQAQEATPTPNEVPAPVQHRHERTDTASSQHDDFGTFNFRNLTVLKQANDDVIRKLKDEQVLPPISPLQSLKSSRSRNPSIDFRQGGPSSPGSPSSSSSGSQAPRTTAPSTPFSIGPVHSRQASELGAAFLPSVSPSVERLRARQPSLTGAVPSAPHHRRNSLPSRLRQVSVSEGHDIERPPLPEGWMSHERRRTSVHTPPGSALSSPLGAHEALPPLQIPSRQTPELQSAPAVDNAAHASPSSLPSALPPLPSRLQTIDCLVAGRNPIVTKVLETMLQRLGCRVVVVPNGGDAIMAAGGIPFDCLFLDLAMPVVDGEKAARMIKSTVNPSANAPIVAVCSHSAAVDDAVGTLFAATLSKPIMKADLLAVLSRLGFKLEVKNPDERRDSDDPASLSPRVQDEPRRGSA